MNQCDMIPDHPTDLCLARCQILSKSVALPLCHAMPCSFRNQKLVGFVGLSESILTNRQPASVGKSRRGLLQCSQKGFIPFFHSSLDIIPFLSGESRAQTDDRQRYQAGTTSYNYTILRVDIGSNRYI